MKKNLLFIFLLLLNNSIWADKPRNWQLNFQDPVTPVMERLHEFHNYLLQITGTIVLVVVILLAYVCIRYNRKANPIPSKNSHNTWIEVIWTIIPVIILIFISIPSFKHLYYMERIEKSELTIKVVGHQWYWSYSYPEYNNFAFDSYIIDDKNLKPDHIRLLDVDNRIVIPVNTNVKFIITSADVIHSFAVPSFGVKMDSIPGRINETWINVKKLGVYYGQCSELCGVNHAFMPIAVEVVSKEEFAEWIKSKTTPL